MLHRIAHRATASFRGALFLLGVTLPGQVAAQQVRITGMVRSGDLPLRRALVEIRSADTVRVVTHTDDRGGYALALPGGRYTFVFRQLGYLERRLESVYVVAGRDGPFIVDVSLEPLAVQLNHLVVSALKRTEKALDAPVSIAVVDEQAIRERTAVSALEYVDGIPGVDMVQQGIESRQVVARGFNQTFGTSLLMMTDYRVASVPSLRANLAQFITPTSEDLDRIEILRGPASALYGPNAADGVVHFISKTPFDAPGTSLSLVGGSRDLFQGSGRTATAMSDRVAVKLSGEYLRGREWNAPDSPTELAPRDPIVERRNAEARMDVRVTPTGTAVLTLGSSLDKRHVEYTSIGTSQIRNWRYDFAQLRYSDQRFFAQAYINVNDAGQTRSLNTLQPVHDNSTLIAGQLQHGFSIGNRTTVTYGADVSRTNPITGGSINGRNEETDVTLETGVYAQAETHLTPRLELLTAARVDRNDRIRGAELSPRVALQYSPRTNQHYRLSYNRAFAEPTTTDMFLDIVAATLAPLPFNIRAVGVPGEGFHFPRTCNGLCRQSPFVAGQLPLDATLLWPAVVQIMKASGVDLTGVPAPTSRDVGTVLRTLDPGAGAFRASKELHDISPLVPTITNSLEFGYKGLLAERLLIDASLYGERRDNFRGPLAVATPNAFLAVADLANYLARFMPRAQADQLGTAIGGVEGSAKATGIPLGTVSPDGRLGGPDIMLTYRDFGRAQLWGADLSAELLASSRVSLRGAYSFVNQNFFASSAPGEPDLSMNAPRNMLSFGARYRDLVRDQSVELRGRYVGGFNMLDGVWTGNVPAFTSVDAEVGLTVPTRRDMRVVFTGQNVLDNRHSEFAGAPVIGRLLLTRVQYRF